MATPLNRLPEPDGESAFVVAAGTVSATYPEATAWRGVAAQAAAAIGMLTGLWVALSPLFIVLQHGGTNANSADVIVGLVAAGVGAVALASPRGFAGLEFGVLLLGVWVIISSFILAAKFAIATPMYWSNTFAGGLLVLMALVGLATLRRVTR